MPPPTAAAPPTMAMYGIKPRPMVNAPTTAPPAAAPATSAPARTVLSCDALIAMAAGSARARPRKRETWLRARRSSRTASRSVSARI